jgi:protein disulfide-isomerase-like protein
MNETNIKLTELQKEIDNGPVFVMFYAPWCGHCKTAKPEFISAAKKLSAAGHKLRMVDCEAEPMAATNYNVKGFPTFKYFKGKTVEDYSGQRTLKGFESFLKPHSLQRGVTYGKAERSRPVRSAVRTMFRWV